ncbi:MAG: GTPase HflX [Pirellula sp.]|jgi:GTP-binding protein HflX|nr:GTPase HflX [Pirellula sp.]
MPEVNFPNDLSWQLCASNESLKHNAVLPKPLGERKPLHTHDRSESLASERSILARLILPNDFESDDPFDELHGLATTAGTEVMGTVIQRREHPDQTTYLGKGKVQELKSLIEMQDADVVLFDNDLNPAQTRNLEKALNIKVLDRSELILDIFASNAQTHEARLAVELAQLEYSLPRLKRMWTHLSRQTMGVGMRGPGEKQLEVDRRLAEKRVHDLKLELAKVERRKEREVASRRGMYSVSLAGYTNAGKSTLMNALTDAGVVAKDKLFATLDTRTRKWMLPGWGPVLLSDTVGFIRDLPHRLIASFRATLEETRQADMLLHVADASNPNVLHQISSVYKVLQEIGIDEKDTLLVLNKVDCEGAAERVEMVKSRYPNAIAISAKSGLGLTQFSVAVSDALTKHFAELEIRLPLDDGKTMAWLAHHAEIISKQYNDDHALVHCRMPSSAAGKLASQGIDLRVIAGKLPIAAENRDPDRATFMPVPPASNETVDGAAGDVEEVA